MQKTFEMHWDAVGSFSEGLAWVKRDGKYGYINDRGEIVIEPQWTFATDFSNGTAVVGNSYSFGPINARGEKLARFTIKMEIKDIFHDEEYFNSHSSMGSRIIELFVSEGKWGYFDYYSNAVISEPQWDVGLYFNNDPFDKTAKVQKNGKWGLIDAEGNVLIEPQWDDVGQRFYLGSAEVKRNGKWGLIDPEGKLLVEPEWDYIDRDDESIVRVKKDGVERYINIRDNIVFERQWDSSIIFSRVFHDGFAMVPRDGKWGIVNSKGKWIANPRWDSIGLVHEGLVRVEKNKKWGFINLQDEIVVEPQWDEVRNFCKGFAEVQKDGKWGFINLQGEVVYEPHWDSLERIFEKFCVIREDGKYGIINALGEVVFEPQWDKLEKDKPAKGFALVRKDGECSYICKRDDELIKLEWSYIADFSHGLACCHKEGKRGYINIRGEVVIEPREDCCGDRFPGDLIEIKRDGKQGFINMQGEIVIEPKWDEVSCFSGGFARVKKDGKYGFINSLGEEICKPRWDYMITHFHAGFAFVYEKEKYGVINTRGEVTAEPQWDEVDDYSEYKDKAYAVLQVKKEDEWMRVNIRGEVIEQAGTDLE